LRSNAFKNFLGLGLNAKPCNIIANTSPKRIRYDCNRPD
jgi:hypothetical protein